MKVVYGVRWIELEFGQRPEGWALNVSLDQARKDAEAASKRGPYSDGSGYCGPERPIEIYEIPFDCLNPEIMNALQDKGYTHTANFWEPKFKSRIK